METYDREMFDFLTEEKSFSTMLSVVNQFEKIRPELITNYWDNVKQKLIDLDSENNWKIINSSSYFIPYSYIGLVKESWEHENNIYPISIRYEKLHSGTYYGLWTHAKSKKWDSASMHTHGKNLKPDGKGFKPDNNGYWPFWKMSEYQFDSNDKLTALLPSRIEETSEQTAQILYNLAEEISNGLDEMYKFKV